MLVIGHRIDVCGWRCNLILLQERISFIKVKPDGLSTGQRNVGLRQVKTEKSVFNAVGVALFRNGYRNVGQKVGAEYERAVVDASVSVS